MFEQCKISTSTMMQVMGAIGTCTILLFLHAESYKGRVCLASDVWSFGLSCLDIDMPGDDYCHKWK